MSVRATVSELVPDTVKKVLLAVLLSIVAVPLIVGLGEGDRVGVSLGEAFVLLLLGSVRLAVAFGVRDAPNLTSLWDIV